MKFHFLTQERMKMGYTRKRHEALVAIADRSRKSFFEKFFVERETGTVITLLTITATTLAVSALQFGHTDLALSNNVMLDGKLGISS